MFGAAHRADLMITPVRIESSTKELDPYITDIRCWQRKNHSSSVFPFGINLLNTIGDIVTVIIATRIIAELTAGVIISCSKAIRDAAIISDNLADSREPAANVSFQVKVNRNNSTGTILTTIAAAKRSGTSSNASFEEINS